jgi:hypothetical protein
MEILGGNQADPQKTVPAADYPVFAIFAAGLVYGVFFYFFLSKYQILPYLCRPNFKSV